MGTRTTYALGTFSWVDLATTDAAAAKAFYAGLFGWDAEDRDAGGGAVYSLCRLDGDAVGGLFAMPPDMRESGLGPYWASYVSVDDAGAAAARGAELGGRVIDDAMDAGTAGRMAVIEDPQGAVLGLWEAGARIGADRVNDVGCLCMNELVTTDPDAAGDYYRELFGWTLEPVGGAPDGTPVAFLMLAGRPNASVFRAPEGVRPHWRPCFTVASAEQATRRIRELGGTVLGEPLDIGDGSLALARDPQGAVFTVFEGETDP